MDVSKDTKVSPRRGDTSKVEPGELLEEGWFFGNLLDRKTRVMSRCFSDPCPSSKVSLEMLVGTSHEETNSSTKRVLFPGDDRRHGRDGLIATINPQPHPPLPSLIRTPSMPSPKPSRVLVQTSLNTASNRRLQRPPSLPAMDMHMDNLEDEESNYSMGRLIRQASLGQSHMLPPRQHTPKKSIPSNTPKQHYPRKKTEQEGSIQRRQQILKQTKSNPSFANVETKQVKDFELSYMHIPIKEIKVLPKMPEEKTMEDMKAQIKFWARSVASNVR